MDVTLVFILLLASIKTTISYRDYPASRMPDYGLDYDMKESRGVHSDDSTRHEHADDEDYKYDYESATSKSPKEFYVEDTTQDNPKRRLPKVMRIDMDKTRNRRRKTFRHETTELESEEDRENKYSLGRDIDHDVDKDDYPLEDDDYKESHEKETSRYNIMRESVNRKARRKPRDRPITVISPEVEHEGNFEKNVKLNMRKNKLQRNSEKEDIAKKIVIEAFDDMKRVNNFKENHPLIIRQPVNRTEFASPSHLQVAYRRAKIDDTTPVSLKVSDITLNLPYNTTLKMEVANKSELSLAERSRLSILKKVLKKENSNVTKTTKPPILMQVTNNMQTVVLVESNNLENEIKKVRRVMDDNPEVIERAKNLMRHKLVANAKGIEDLTANWDEMVCDYIDLNLLNSASSRICVNLYCLKFIMFVIIFKIYSYFCCFFIYL